MTKITAITPLAGKISFFALKTRWIMQQIIENNAKIKVVITSHMKYE